ncbi:MAG: nucleoside triphosphate pyrophosphohydrolase [Chthoniobacterales bacterium]
MMQRLFEIVTRLRAPDGCPWDREQTHASLRGALVEECYEVVDAINRSDDANLREELGDLLLHVVFHAQLAEDRGAFDFDGVAADICEKLVRRHPHVFGDDSAMDSEEVLRKWEQIKRKEKGEGASILDGRDSAQPALVRAQNVQKKAARVGFDWSEADPVFAKLEEEIAELREALQSGRTDAIEDEMGDILFTMVNLSRKVKVDAETALSAATAKFIRRFQWMESDLAAEGKSVEQTELAELEERWIRAKKSSNP